MLQLKVVCANIGPLYNIRALTYLTHPFSSLSVIGILIWQGPLLQLLFALFHGMSIFTLVSNIFMSLPAEKNSKTHCRIMKHLTI